MKGVAGTLANLAEIDKKAARKALKIAVDEAVKPILKDARANVPTDTKTLKKALGKKVKSYRNSLVVVGVVGPRKDKKGAKATKRKKLVRTTSSGRQIWRDPVKYAHLIEFGTRPHSLGKGDKIARKDGRRSKVQQSRGARRHPGTRANPFLRPALDKNRRNSREIMKRVLREHLKQARKGKR